MLLRTGANCLSAWQPAHPAGHRALAGAGQPPWGWAWAVLHLQLPPSRPGLGTDLVWESQCASALPVELGQLPALSMFFWLPGT